MDTIKAVIFDVGDVLNLGSRTAQETLARKLGLSLEQIRKIWRTTALPLSTGAINEAEFWRRVDKQYPLPPYDRKKGWLGPNYAACIKPNRNALRVARSLPRQGLRRAILSNTLPPHAVELRRAGIYNGFDPVILSCEVGLRKPDREIFTLVLRRLSMSAEETILVDDSKLNVSTAQDMGFHTILFTPRTHLRTELRRILNRR